ncbi:DUF4829 domain-containing protein [Planomonospora corallina]|uniref:DUF4829 domain-containing protein n=1 Tax=Planomonospora corallina TaxID=1806052 RepID=A0ABV8IDQ9_9ACTN
MRVSVRIVVAFILAIMGTVLVAGCQDGDEGTALPGLSAGASPQEVVRAYVAAINAHDMTAGQELSTPYFAERKEGVVDSLFEDAKLSDVVIHAPDPISGYESPDGKRYREAVYVSVSFTLWHSDEGSMPNGSTVWGYMLVRDDPGRPWRINGDGIH